MKQVRRSLVMPIARERPPRTPPGVRGRGATEQRRLSALNPTTNFGRQESAARPSLQPYLEHQACAGHPTSSPAVAASLLWTRGGARETDREAGGLASASKRASAASGRAQTALRTKCSDAALAVPSHKKTLAFSEHFAIDPFRSGRPRTISSSRSDRGSRSHCYSHCKLCLQQLRTTRR